MKTPREILLARHAGAQPELDELSQGVVEKMRRASEPGAVASAPRSVLSINPQPSTINHHARPSVAEAVRTWLWPSPFAWAGLVAVWLIVLGANGTVGDLRGRSVVALRQTAPTQLEAIREQRRLYAELVGDRNEADLRALSPSQYHPRTPSARPAPDRPRSERRPNKATV
jgi:hypothetical protein